MSGVWSTPTLDLVLPSNGSLTPGSGTTYIGGPRLPADLTLLGVDSAIVFYSTPQGLANNVWYWYIAHFTVGTDDLLVEGWMEAGGVNHIVKNDYVRDGGVTRYRILTKNTQYVELAGTTRVVDDVGIELRAASAPANGIFINTGAGVIKAIGAGTVLDTWQTSTTTQTIAGVANCNVKVAWRQTPDYVIEARFFVTVPGGGLPAIPTFSSFNLPGAMPVPDMGVLINQGPHYAGNYTAGAAQGSFNGRYEAGKAYVFGLPAGVTFLEGSGTFTQVKP